MSLFQWSVLWSHPPPPTRHLPQAPSDLPTSLADMVWRWPRRAAVGAPKPTINLLGQLCHSVERQAAELSDADVAAVLVALAKLCERDSFFQSRSVPPACTRACLNLLGGGALPSCAGVLLLLGLPTSRKEQTQFREATFPHLPPAPQRVRQLRFVLTAMPAGTFSGPSTSSERLPSPLCAQDENKSLQ